MSSITWTVERQNAKGELEEIELKIEYTCSPYDPGCTYGPPENCYPPEGGEIEELTAYGPDGKEFKLTDEENEKLESHIYENHDYSEE
jgi:hypothetical protein